ANVKLAASRSAGDAEEVQDFVGWGKCVCNVAVTRPLTGHGSPEGLARRKAWLAGRLDSPEGLARLRTLGEPRRVSDRVIAEDYLTDRFWLITRTCYGNWLPGDGRGFVGNVREPDGTQIVHDIPGTPYDADMPRLESWVRQHLTGPPVTLEQPEAEALIAQYRETARIREWSLEAASVMYNHT